MSVREDFKDKMRTCYAIKTTNAWNRYMYQGQALNQLEGENS